MIVLHLPWNPPNLLAAFPSASSHAHPRVRADRKMSVREQDYQIQIRILEARQLAGTQLDPVCTVTVGTQKKSTTIKEQTNCPYWEEVGWCPECISHMQGSTLQLLRSEMHSY